MSTILKIILITSIAGVGGTGLGGVVGALFKKDSDKTVSLLLSFAAGVMLSVVCFDLVTSAISEVGSAKLWIVIVSIVAGIGIVYLLNNIIDSKTKKEIPHLQQNHPKTADDLDEITHSDHLLEHMKNDDSKSSLFVAGIVMLCAIALHNIPEGMTIGASYANAELGEETIKSALLLAVLIGFHNIPEGMAIGVPLISGGMKKYKAILLTALSGLPTVIGAIIGYAIGNVGAVGLCVSLGFASGAMLYVVFGEILPQSYLMYKSKLPAFFAVLGMIVGIIVIYI